MVAVVLLASLLATSITAAWLAVQVRREQAENLRRAATTLAEASFPLTAVVLAQSHALSGAEFVLVDHGGEIRESTLTLDAEARVALSRLAQSPRNAAAQTGITFAGRDYLVELVDIQRGGSSPATLISLYAEDQLSARVFEAVYPALIAGLASAGVAMALTVWLARRLVRPLHTLAARTAAIAEGDFAPMPLGRRNDELRDLSASINRMAGQLAEHQRSVRREERLKTLDKMGAALAHQLRNAAAGGRMAIELHRRECPGGDDQSLEVALRQLGMMESYLRQFLSLGETAPTVARRVELAPLVEEALALLRPSCQHAGIELRFTAPSRPLFIQGDAETLRQLITNLATNAIEAAAAGRTTPRWVSLELTAGDGRGRLEVGDSGDGPPAALGDELFEAFVTTKPEGFGIGLFVARQIASRHGGQLRWRREGNATCFTFDFTAVE
jgi:signal transduction histidine kinase